jgi:hypothetical protein
MACPQWPFQEPKLEVPTIYKAYIRPKFHGIKPKRATLCRSARRIRDTPLVALGAGGAQLLARRPALGGGQELCGADVRVTRLVITWVHREVAEVFR